MPRSGASLEEKQAWMRERQSLVTLPAPASSSAPFNERHYSVAEVSKMWGISTDKVRKIFRSEPGVLVIPGDQAGYKRGYSTLRIPESVLQRVHRRLTNYS